MWRILDLLKSLGRRRSGLIACPKCGSVRIRQSNQFYGWAFPALYVCDDCDYSGCAIIELEKM